MFLLIVSLFHHLDVRPNASSGVFLFSGPFVEVFPRLLEDWSRVAYEEDNLCVCLFSEISTI